MCEAVGTLLAAAVVPSPKSQAYDWIAPSESVEPAPDSAHASPVQLVVMTASGAALAGPPEPFSIRTWSMSPTK